MPPASSSPIASQPPAGGELPGSPSAGASGYLVTRHPTIRTLGLPRWLLHLPQCARQPGVPLRGLSGGLGLVGQRLAQPSAHGGGGALDRAPFQHRLKNADQAGHALPPLIAPP